MQLRAYQSDNILVDVDALYFDGYYVSERLLEGLSIKVTLTKDKTDIIISADWPKGVDAEHMAAGAKKFALFNDIFSTTPELDNDDGFIVKDPHAAVSLSPAMTPDHILGEPEQVWPE